MFSKSHNWMRRNMKSVRFATILSFVALIVAFGVVQASGPMRPHPPGGMGMWGQVRRVWYPMEPVPTIKIIAVVQDSSVTFETADFPTDEEFTVTMGYMYTRGVNGIEVGTFNSGDGTSLQQTFDIPEDLHGQYKISIRAQTDHTFPYFSFNWFYNNSTEVTATPVDSEDAETAEAETEEAEEVTEAEETEETTTEEAEEVAEAEEAAPEEAAGELTGQAWQWVEFMDPVLGEQEIDAPQNYQVEFLPEGGINIQADCNMGTGSYTTEDGSLTVSIGAMTLAQCQEGSRGDEFVNNLSASATYFIEDGDLFIDLAADGGGMKFSPAGAETADDSAGTGGAEATTEGEEATTEEAEETTEGEEATTEEAAETTEGEEATTEEAAETTEGEEATTEEAAEATEGEEATTEEAAEATEGEEATTEEAEEAAEAEEAPADTTGLVGGAWQWAEFSDPVEGVVAVENSELYTAEFLTDGTVSVQADCNSGRGNYTADGSNITISDLAMTRALCAEDSLSDDFVMYLTTAAIYFFEDVNLYFDLPADGGTMKFDPAEGEETAFVARNPALKTAAQDDAVTLNSETNGSVPTFKVCTVVKDTGVFIVTADFPEGEVFDVTMGPLLVAAPMKPMYGPMPMPGQMPAHPPATEPYQQGPMQPMGQMDMGMGQMDMGMGYGDMGMGYGDMGMGYGDMGSMCCKPMAPKTYVPFYYEAGTLESGDGGMIETRLEIPSELAGYYRIQIMMRTEHQYPYYAYNWFYNNDAAVCNDENGDS